MRIEKQIKTFSGAGEAEDYAREMRARGWAASVHNNLPKAGYKVIARRPLVARTEAK